MNNTGKILTAFTAGMAAGTTIVFLFAPDKGSKTSKKINKQGKKIANNVKDKFQKGKEKVNDLKKDIEQFVTEKAEEIA